MRDAGNDVRTAMEEAANATSALFIRLNARTGFASQTAGELRKLASTAVEGRAQRIKDLKKNKLNLAKKGFLLLQDEYLQSQRFDLKQEQT